MGAGQREFGLLLERRWSPGLRVVPGLLERRVEERARRVQDGLGASRATASAVGGTTAAASPIADALERAAVVPPWLELGSHHERPRGRYEDAVDGDVVGVGLAHPERVGPRSTLERLSLMRE